MRQEIKNKMTPKKSVFKRRIIKSLIYTILSVFVSIWGVFALLMKIFSDHSQEAQGIYLIISFFVITIFIILFCTFTILYKLGNR
jgi:magnesium-transporting ATPase (P-type)